ncbi:flagellar hook assembly protein FlgD [Limnobacter humi]|uniref:Basal-body rod modification protein FlgD n=1 Tax=Limnobacter humi TaxID=1778671 RepID=A0ABT1WJ43_9BURK|nr:flagellar hook assembly protein FlgD [Limnobacter humi]MCQ8897541.1 flagellar hook assembly protein FlgD [Limnobacter humi]
MVASVDSTAARSAQKANNTAGLLGKPEDVEAIQTRFLELLVAQLRNQDPLAPMDNAQVTSQMAQLNTVSGIQNLNKTMEGLGEIIAAGQFSQAVALVDKLVLVQGNRLTYSDQPTAGQFRADGAYDRTVVSIKNGAGQVVRNLDLGRTARGMGEFTWDGKDDNGTKLPAGNYTFDVQGVSGDSMTALSTYSYDVIQSVDNNGASGFSIGTARGGSIKMSDIVKVF